MKASWLAACAAIALAGCATNNQGTSAHRLSVELVGADSADCLSPQAVEEYAIIAPGVFLVEPESPTVEVICNAEGYQETYASFGEVYVDGSAGSIAFGYLAGGLIGLAATASQDSLDSLPNRVTITMVQEGEVHGGMLAEAHYNLASDSVLPVSHLSPAYTRVRPPEGSELTGASAATESQMTDSERTQSQEAKMRRFETDLRNAEERLVQHLDHYNKRVEFATSYQRTLKISEIYEIEVLSARSDGYVVRIVGNSTAALTSLNDVFDELFLIEDRRGNFRVVGHGKRLKSNQVSARL